MRKITKFVIWKINMWNYNEKFKNACILSISLYEYAYSFAFILIVRYFLYMGVYIFLLVILKKWRSMVDLAFTIFGIVF